MFRKNYHIRIDLPGGIIAGGDLFAIVEAAEAARAPEIRFGTRQQLYCKVADKYGPAFLGDLDKAGIVYSSGEDGYPNIISSYVVEDVFQQANWVGEGIYKDILDGFDFRPRLKINLVEATQSFIPFFTGHLNFVSSSTGNYWYLFIRWPGTGELYRWPGLVYTRDIPRISRLIGEAGLTGDGDRLFRDVQEIGQFVIQPLTEELKLPPFSLPYYEGFNRFGGKLWLGIYRRDEGFPVAFLKDICLICQQTKIGQLYTTPWKSLIVKGIATEDRALWDFALGKHRINVRHASNELNWFVEDLCEDGLKLKRYLVRQFDNDDIRTYGLCFTIRTRPGTGLFGSVLIRRQENRSRNQRAALERYDILYTQDLNANSKDYVVFREGLEKENLGAYLISLCKYFYELQSEVDLIPQAKCKTNRSNAEDAEKKFVHQCRHCLSLYDEQYGEPDRGLPPGLTFGETGEGYTCAVCGAPRTDFVRVGDPAGTGEQAIPSGKNNQQG